MAKRTLHLKVSHEADGSYFGQVDGFANLITEADTLDELVVMITDVIDMLLDETVEYDRRKAAGESLEHIPSTENRYLTRVIGMDIEVEEDHRPPGSDAITQQGPRRRLVHREDWPAPPRQANP